jgi:o-succinylbenzoate synthase
LTVPIREARLFEFRLPLSRPWRFAQRCIEFRAGWLVCLTDAAGNRGWGEATPFPELGTERLAAAHGWIQGVCDRLPGRRPAQALQDLPAAGACPPAARCGVETALLDLAAIQAGTSLAEYLVPGCAGTIQVNAFAGPLLDTRATDLLEAAAAGFRCVKLKAGQGDPEMERRHLEVLVPTVPAEMQVRLDANRSWTGSQARRFVAGLPSPPLTLLEEPLGDATLDQLAALRRLSPVPLAMDEGLTHTNLEAVLAAAPVDVLILKPMRLGGLLPCLQIQQRAVAAGMQALVTSTLDGATGIWAAVHLAAAMDADGIARFHGLATSTWLARDLGAAPEVRNGCIALPGTPGLGIAPHLLEAHP